MRIFRIRMIMAILAISGLFSASHADIYKCISKGHVSYQGYPCKESERSIKVEIARTITPEQQKKALEKLEALRQRKKEEEEKRREMAAESYKEKMLEEKIRRIARSEIPPRPLPPEPVTIVREVPVHHDEGFGTYNRFDLHHSLEH